MLVILIVIFVYLVSKLCVTKSHLISPRSGTLQNWQNEYRHSGWCLCAHRNDTRADVLPWVAAETKDASRRRHSAWQGRRRVLNALCDHILANVGFSSASQKLRFTPIEKVHRAKIKANAELQSSACWQSCQCTSTILTLANQW